ncbi:MAG: hypothetical protein P4L64_18255 [Caulobacteraceae bacterium]|nr:hypothetical protein [Caulobacteraceae bacterium]
MSAHLPAGEIADLDARLVGSGVPPISVIRLRFQKDIQRVLKRGAIKSEVEYYALRNAVEGVSDDAESQRIWMMLAAFEEKVAK